MPRTAPRWPPRPARVGRQCAMPGAGGAREAASAHLSARPDRWNCSAFICRSSVLSTSTSSFSPRSMTLQGSQPGRHTTIRWVACASCPAADHLTRPTTPSCAPTAARAGLRGPLAPLRHSERAGQLGTTPQAAPAPRVPALPAARSPPCCWPGGACAWPAAQQGTPGGRRRAGSVHGLPSGIAHRSMFSTMMPFTSSTCGQPWHGHACWVALGSSPTRWGLVPPLWVGGGRRVRDQATHAM